MHTRRFARGAVASPHHLASAAGQAVLVDGGNAVDAAVAANLVLAVVTPYHCGVGGDLLAVVWDGRAHGVVSVGAAPAGATPEAVRAAIAAGHGSATSLPGTAGMPTHGALPVTVPGAAAGWAHLLERWGTRSFGDLAAAASRYAEDGFPPSRSAVELTRRAHPLLVDQPGWEATYGPLATDAWFRQPALARTLRALADDGPDALYRGPVGASVVEVLQAHGSTMTADDLADHRVAEVAPLVGRFRDREVLELPPPTQGVTALTALGILDRLPPRGDDEVAALHHEIEAVRLALLDRQDHLGDPRAMRTSPGELLDPARLDRLAAGIGQRAADLPLARPAPGGTAYLCAGDGDGLLISLIQSNFVGYGSGVVVPGWGFGLHDRGAHLKLDVAADDPDVLAPGRRPLHTLIPAMTLRDGEPELVFGTMGGDGQAQLHAQLLRRWVDAEEDLQAGLDAPRFVVDLADGAVVAEPRVAAPVMEALRARGHDVRLVGPYEHGHGHAHALRVDGRGYAGASDPRCEGAVTGW
ncbi:gamma-glutamyltransferase [Nitriliruptoraceae bacterium ZYF776]|nr:gamma-glutamyltransferase [Profundirhabdus halotolerans]